MQTCWNRKCNCHNFRKERIAKTGYLYLHRVTCPVCKTVWYAGLTDDDVQVMSADEPEAKVEKAEVAE